MLCLIHCLSSIRLSGFALNQGEPCVGKTALTQVFVNGSGAYPKNYLMTIGADFTIKQIPIESTNVIVELYIFDSAGQSIFNQVEMNSKYVGTGKFRYIFI